MRIRIFISVRKEPFLIFLLACFLCPALSAQPVMKFEHKLFELGEVQQGDSVTRTFTIKNSGDKDLWFRRWYASSGISVQLPQEALRPGQEDNITFTWRTAGQCGFRRMNFGVETNKQPDHSDGHSTSINFQVRGRVLFDPQNFDGPKLYFKTRMVDFGEIGLDTLLRQTVQLINTGSRPVLLKKERIIYQKVKYLFQLPMDSIAPGDTAQIRVAILSKEIPCGEFRDSIAINPGPCLPTEYVLIQVNKLCDSSFVPPVPEYEFDKTTIDFGTIRHESHKFYSEFVVYNTGQIPLEIEMLKSAGGGLLPRYSREPILPGDCQKIHVMFDPKGKRGRMRKSLALRFKGVPKVERLFLEGNIEPEDSPPEIKRLPIKFSTEMVDLGLVPPGENRIATFDMAYGNPDAINLRVLAPKVQGIGTRLGFPSPVGLQIHETDSRCNLAFGQYLSYQEIKTNDGNSARQGHQLRIKISNPGAFSAVVEDTFQVFAMNHRDTISLRVRYQTEPYRYDTTREFYTEYGFLEKKQVWEDGKLKRVTKYSTDGRIFAEYVFGENGSLTEKGYQGAKKYERDRNETGERLLTYREGKLENEAITSGGGPSEGVTFHRSWWPNGNLRLVYFEKDGFWVGKKGAYYENGQMEYETNLHLNYRDGLYQRWYPNGQLMEEGNYDGQNLMIGENGWGDQVKNSRKIGKWKFWSWDGKLIRKEVYKKGKLARKKVY